MCEASKAIGHEVAVLADLPGPKIRVRPFPEGGVEMTPGAEVKLSEAERPSSNDEICVNVAGLFTGLAEDDQVVLGDGNIMLRVTSAGGQSVIAQVVTGGRVQGAPGVHVPSERLSASTPTPDDLLFAEQMAAAGVEFIAVSFVRTARDIDEVRKVVGDRAQLIAKIETSAALAAITDIVSTSDGVMVARGDLGIDCPLEEVPHLQKMIIRECVERGIPVITATQMLESMVSAAAVPTRAEASDVANAVFDGTDAVMLSGETAVAITQSSLLKRCQKLRLAERQASYRGWAARLGRHQRGNWNSAEDRITAALGNAASQVARDIGATAILCCTQSGRTARAMARFRPEATLIGLSPDEKVVRALRLSWGVDPMPVDVYESTDEMVVVRRRKSGATRPNSSRRHSACACRCPGKQFVCGSRCVAGGASRMMSARGVWFARTGVEGGPQMVMVHGSLDRSTGLSRLTRRFDDRRRHFAFRSSRLRKVGRA